MSKFCGILLVFSVALSLFVTNPIINVLLVDSDTAQMVASSSSDLPLDMNRFYSCVIESYEVCSDSRFYEFYTSRSSSFNNYFNSYSYSGMIAGYTEPYLYSLFYEVLTGISSDEYEDLPVLHPDFYPLVYQLTLTHYFDEETYFSLLKGYSPRDTNSHAGGSYD